MRRNARRRAEKPQIWEDKRIIISGAIIVAVIVIIVGATIFSNITNNNYIGEENPSQIIDLESGKEIENNNIESASSAIGNTVKQSEQSNTTSEVTAKNEVANTTNTNTATAQNKANNNTTTNTKVNIEKEVAPTSSKTANDEKVSFDWPVKGEILKAFSMDNLLYSATLQEWTTHNGVDIKADKASVVKSAADGTIKSIKNDPRFGLTVTIEHENGYKTIYSNLLTAEFVVEGEKVKQGQSIGTVGNTANFEVADDFHLHFEVLKDSEYVDPMIYLK